MAILPIINIGGAIIGQILHIIKKKTEETGAEEKQVFKDWVVKRPVNTIIATLGSVFAAMALQTEHADQVVTIGTYASDFINAVLIGIAGNSTLNRPGKTGG